MKAGETYIQKNPLFGRKVIRFDKVRDSVWDWEICDATVVTIDKEPAIVRVKSAASSIYDHQGLTTISSKVFDKIFNLTKILQATERVSDEQQNVIRRQETLGKIVSILFEVGIIDDSTYDEEHLRRYAIEYEDYSNQQMKHITDVIDVHK